MRIRRKLTSILCSTLVATVLAHSDLEARTNEGANAYFSIQRDLIEEYAIYHRVSNYVHNIVNQVGGYRDQVETREGRNFDEKKQRFIEESVRGDFYPVLDAVYKGKVSDADLEEITINMANELKKDDPNGYCDFDNPGFREALKSRLRLRVEFLGKLANAPPPLKSGEEGWKELIRSSYSKEEFQEFLIRQDKAVDEYFDSMYRTLNPIFKLFWIAKHNFNAMKEENKKVNHGFMKDFQDD